MEGILECHMALVSILAEVQTASKKAAWFLEQTQPSLPTSIHQKQVCPQQVSSPGCFVNGVVTHSQSEEWGPDLL